MNSFKLFPVLWSLLLWGLPSVAQEEKTYKIHSVAFYNLENLFDTEDDPLTFDNERTPTGKDHWTEEIYQHKITNMAHVISQIGREVTGDSPVIIGLCELENRKVLEDLIADPALRNKNYGIVHFNSPDRRGIDVALIYQRAFFVPKHAVSHTLYLHDRRDPTRRVYTRDQLAVSGFLEGEEINVLVNHWPSRSGGVAASSYKREQAAQLTRHILDSIYMLDPYSKILITGDFNDDPQNKSLKKILNTKAKREEVEPRGIFNPMEDFALSGMGTLAYRDAWNLFDQILISHSLLKRDYSTYRFYKAGIFNPGFLITPTGQYRGYPFRSFGSSGFTGGYSDHFPVYVYLIRENEASGF